MQIGYKLATEAFAPTQIVQQAVLAEQAGFDFVEMSDHYHPWLESQGHSGYTWSMLGAMAARTERIGLVTGVTCPSFRYHPAIVAQAAATVALLSDGRFTLGVGAGERLNEHVVGGGWPSVSRRHQIFREALEIIRLLWRGGYQSYDGRFLQLEDAQVFDLPDTPPVMAVAISGPKSLAIACELGDGLFATEPKGALVQTFREAKPDGPRYCEVPLACARRAERGAGGAGQEPLGAHRLEGDGGAAEPGQLRGVDQHRDDRGRHAAVRLRARRRGAPGQRADVRRRRLRPPRAAERRPGPRGLPGLLRR